MGAAPANDPDAYRAAAPLHHVHERVPPMLLIHVTEDAVVPVTQSPSVPVVPEGGDQAVYLGGALHLQHVAGVVEDVHPVLMRTRHERLRDSRRLPIEDFRHHSCRGDDPDAVEASLHPAGNRPSVAYWRPWLPIRHGFEKSIYQPLKIFKFELLQCKLIIVSVLMYYWRWLFRDHGAYQIDSRTFDFRSCYRTLLASVAEGYRREQE